MHWESQSFSLEAGNGLGDAPYRLCNQQNYRLSRVGYRVSAIAPITIRLACHFLLPCYFPVHKTLPLFRAVLVCKTDRQRFTTAAFCQAPRGIFGFDELSYADLLDSNNGCKWVIR